MVLTMAIPVQKQPRYDLVRTPRNRRGIRKVHLYRRSEGKTLCGLLLTDVTPEDFFDGLPELATCQGCLMYYGSAMRAERQARDSRLDPEWWSWYDAYLDSPEWAAKRTRVMERAGRMCEGCGCYPAVQVHHLTYAHAGNEFLFELVAICLSCHAALHPGTSDGLD
jgi:hypothetical protein